MWIERNEVEVSHYTKLFARSTDATKAGMREASIANRAVTASKKSTSIWELGKGEERGPTHLDRSVR